MNVYEIKNNEGEYKYQIKYDDLWFGYEYDAEELFEEPLFFNPLDQSICHPEQSSLSREDIKAIEGKIFFPNERGLDLGRSLIFQFIEKCYPNFVDEVDEIFRKKGAFRRFKDFIVRQSIRDKWHEYQNYYTVLKLVEWANDNDLEVIELENLK